MGYRWRRATSLGYTLFGMLPRFGAQSGVIFFHRLGNNPLTADFVTGATTATSKTAAGLPCDGRRLYVSLYTYLNGAADWQRPPQQYTYQAASGCSP
jgi:hypothetical protein